MDDLPHYEAEFARWQKDPQQYWAQAAAALCWVRPPRIVHDENIGPHGGWFPDGLLNTSYNCLDRHVAEGRGDQDALIWDSPLSGSLERYSYSRLLAEVSRCAGALRDAGVTKGERVLIYMPMVPEAVIAMLATARLGAVHSVVFGGFAPSELALRIADARPGVIVTASCGIEPTRLIAYKPLLDEAIARSGHAPRICFVLQRPMLQAEMIAGRDIDFAAALVAAKGAEPVSVSGVDPLYILYTSGSTGKPKGVVRDNGGHAVALLHSMKTVYGVGGGEVMFAASDLGWAVGHSYIVYAPLLAGCTTILYEGKPVGTPDAGALWRVCAEHAVKVLFTAPTAIRAVRQHDPDGVLLARHNPQRLAAIFLAGERCDPATANWLATTSQRPVIDHWWQTETGWAITAGFQGYVPFVRPLGSGGRAAPGWKVLALDDAGEVLRHGEVGNLAIRLPLAPGAGTTLWNNDEGYRAAYLRKVPGYYVTGDAGRVDSNGDVWVLGRTDDVINVAGHRLSTGAMEELIASHPDVAECAVVAMEDALKGEVPVGFFVLRQQPSGSATTVARELIDLVRNRIGAIAVFKQAHCVEKLPKTRSGKIVRKLLRSIVNGHDINVPPHIEDGAVVQQIAALLRRDHRG